MHVRPGERCRVVRLVVQGVNLGNTGVVIFHFFDASIPVCKGTFQGQE